MWSSNVGRFIVAIIVMIVLMGLTANHILDDDNSAKWRGLSADGLNAKIQTGLTQMYWQWQNQGRSNQIEYKPGNVQHTIVIEMTKRGVPKVEKSNDGCRVFLSWFIEENVLSNQVEVSTTFIERKVTHEVLPSELKENIATTYVCQFIYANKILQFDLMTGLFTFTD